MGRPKNGWTPTRLRKLVRLYLMTNLDVVEISKVLRAKGFEPWSVYFYSPVSRAHLNLEMTDISNSVNAMSKNSLISFCRVVQTRFEAVAI
jgi:hypothetical protein